jgi:hypothetical protein
LKRIAKTVLAGVVIVAALGLLAAASFSMLFAVFLWPGFLIMNYVYRLLGFQGIAFTDFGLVFWPALVINVVLYALLYLLLGQAAAWKQRKQRV